MDINYIGSIYIIILGAGKTISWPFHIDRFGGFGDFFGGGIPSFIEPHLPVDGIGSRGEEHMHFL